MLKFKKTKSQDLEFRSGSREKCRKEQHLFEEFRVSLHTRGLSHYVLSPPLSFIRWYVELRFSAIFSRDAGTFVHFRFPCENFWGGFYIWNSEEFKSFSIEFQVVFTSLLSVSTFVSIFSIRRY